VAYVVVVGDTLWDIAQRHGVTVEALLAANLQVTDRRLIHAGDRITIPPAGWQAPLATELIRNGSYQCEGGALAGKGVPGEGFAIINAESPRDLMAQVSLRDGLPNATYTVQLIQSAGLGGTAEDWSVVDATLITDSHGNGYAIVREARLPDTIGAFVYLVHLGDATGPLDLHGTRLVPVGSGH